MKRALTMLAAVIAVPLFAADTAKTTAAKPPAEKPKAATASTAPAAPAAVESPLVAAARRANRLGKKPVNVITNETLVKANSGGTQHITTAASQPELKLPAEFQAPPRPTPEMTAAYNAAEVRKAMEAKAKKESEEKAKRQQRLEAGTAAYEDDMFDEAEADAARAARDLKKEQSQKPPQV